VSRNQVGAGYDVVKEDTQRQLANTKYVEAEFKRGQVSEGVLVTVREGYAVVFIFTAANSADLEKFISSAQIAFAEEPHH
jgi:hypothetical protein